MSKRKASRILETVGKKCARDWNEWVGASKTRNFALGDTLVDYLEKTNESFSSRAKPSSFGDFATDIMRAGNEFESIIIERIRERFPGYVVTISDSPQSQSMHHFEKTLDAMRAGAKIIFQGVLHDTSNLTYGCPDLIVRSDILNKMTAIPSIEDAEAKRKAPLLVEGNYHYRIVDIKYSTLHLAADATHILKQGSVPAYKTQLAIYNSALGFLQGYQPGQAYILGKKWTSKKGTQQFGCSTWNDRFGVVDYDGRDSQYYEIANEAVMWILNLRKNYTKWSLSPPSIPELYPNMCCTMSGKWMQKKYEIATELKDISIVWMCGKKNKDAASKLGITRWDDPRCNSKALGFNQKTRTSFIVDEILETNRGHQKIRPEKIRTNIYNWKEENKLDFYVDFETVSDIFDASKEVTDQDKPIITMIGVGWINPDDGLWKFSCFVGDDMTRESEKVLSDRFFSYVKRIQERYDSGTSRMIHWSKAEQFQLESVTNLDEKDTNLVWLDLLDVFKEEPITVKGAFNFGLKSIAKAMKSHGMIDTIWEAENPCADGLSAMLYSWREYSLRKEGVKSSELMRDISKYNEVDVKTLYEIITFLRTNHI